MKINLNVQIHPSGEITFDKNALMQADLGEIMRDLPNVLSLNKNPREDLIPAYQIILDKIEEEGFIIEDGPINIDVFSYRKAPLSFSIGFNRKRPEIWWPIKRKRYTLDGVAYITYRSPSDQKWITVKHPIRMLNPILNFLYLQKWAYDLTNEI